MTMSEINVFKDTRQAKHNYPLGGNYGEHLYCELQNRRMSWTAILPRSQSSYSLVSKSSVGTDNSRSSSPSSSTWSLNDNTKHMIKKKRNSYAIQTERVTCPPCLSGDISAVDSQGRSLLFYAARYGQSDTLLQLLQAGCDPNQTDNQGRTPLHEAVDKGHVEIIKLLLTEGKADVSARAADGQTPFLTAVSRGEMGVVRLLHMHGANPDDCDKEGVPSICRAFKQGWGDVADFLLSRCRDVNQCSANGESCFYAAAHNDKPLPVEVIRKLLKTDYDLKKDKHWLVNEGCPVCLRDDAKLHQKVIEGAGIVDKAQGKKFTFRKISVGKAKIMDKLSKSSR